MPDETQEISFQFVLPEQLQDFGGGASACAKDQFRTLQGLESLATAINSGKATLREVRKDSRGSRWTFVLDQGNKEAE